MGAGFELEKLGLELARGGVLGRELGVLDRWELLDRDILDIWLEVLRCPPPILPPDLPPDAPGLAIDIILSFAEIS